jgi:DNA-binding HxlR family transcriptional regulator
METEPKDVIVLGSIRRGKKKFSNIQNETKITSEELNSILEDLENKGYIKVEEKKGWFGRKIELQKTVQMN